MSKTLFIVSTPIGNLKDITLRAIETLKEVDFIACEDTRVTAFLLNHFEIKKEMVSLNAANELSKIEYVINRINPEKAVPWFQMQAHLGFRILE